MSRVGGQLATAMRGHPDRMHLFHIDAAGVLCCAERNGSGWTRVPIPQADGLPFSTDMHPAGALMTGYQSKGAQLDVFAVDRDGMLRVYSTPGRSWEADVVPEAVGIPPGACLATGYQGGGSVLDVFVVGRSGEPLVFQGTDDGRWRPTRVPLPTALPHGANLTTGYQNGGARLTAFAIDRDGQLQAVSESGDGSWRVESPTARLNGDGLELPPGAPLAVGYPGGAGELTVFTVDARGRLCAIRRGRLGWESQVLPASGLHSPAGLATGYQHAGRQLLVFVVDEDGRLRQYAQDYDGTWSVGLIPNGVGLPPGAALTTGYRADLNELDVFVLAEFSAAPIYYTAREGGWTGPYRI
ncbi:MAG: hypothetical protein ACRDVE_11005 [Actinocrinis sp.]